MVCFYSVMKWYYEYLVFWLLSFIFLFIFYGHPFLPVRLVVSLVMGTLYSGISLGVYRSSNKKKN